MESWHLGGENACPLAGREGKAWGREHGQRQVDTEAGASTLHLRTGKGRQMSSCCHLDVTPCLAFSAGLTVSPGEELGNAQGKSQEAFPVAHPILCFLKDSQSHK